LGVGREMAHRRLATHGDSARSEGNDNDGPKKGSRKLVRWSVRSTKQVRSSRNGDGVGGWLEWPDDGEMRLAEAAVT
jgi:hypothetical protein